MPSHGLTSAQAQAARRQHGPNTVTIQPANPVLQLLHWLISPINLMLLSAVILSFISGRLFDAYFIVGLIAVNTVLSAVHHQRAEAAIATLQKRLVVMVNVERDNRWRRLAASELVVGDLIALGIGDIVPADAAIVAGDNISINEAAVTGESLPQTKLPHDTLLTGSSVLTGSLTAAVTAIGDQTTYGKSLVLVEQAKKRSLLEDDMLRISYLLFAVSAAAVVALTIVLRTTGQPITEILRLDLSLVIAGIPVSLPTVMTIIIELGVLGLSHRNVIVRRLGALENLANTNLLLIDKTGTLTEDRISVANTVTYGKTSEVRLLQFAAMATGELQKSPIDQAICDAASRLQANQDFTVSHRIPFDSVRKRVTIQVRVGKTEYLISSGAPQVITPLCQLTTGDQKRVHHDIARLAADGFRLIAVAVRPRTSKEQNLKLLGFICLADRPRADAKATIAALGREGIKTRMITGDNLAIGRQVAMLVGLPGNIQPAKMLRGSAPLNKWWQQTAGYAEVLPTDKYALTEAAKRHNLVAVTGDGMNDLPAVRAADVGIAVKNAVDALRQSADIVILANGISVIRDALIESRKIFERLYSYSVYRISESFRLVISIAVLGFIVHSYPITPIQLIMIAFLNDLPIITLAYNHVRTAHRPANSRSAHKLLRGLLHGSVGVVNSVLFYFLMTRVWHLPLPLVQTAFFLKLTVSGHLLIYVAHTDVPWYRFLPSRQVILATTITQLIATAAAGLGLFMAAIPLWLIVAVWLWAFLFMQASDYVKVFVPQK